MLKEMNRNVELKFKIWHPRLMKEMIR